MSKQSEAKVNQSYTTTQKNCGNCKYFTSRMEKSSWGNHYNEKELRCSIGGFKVNKTAACNEHEMPDV
jgi:ribosomal protein L37E